MLVRQMTIDDMEPVREVGQKAWSKLASEEMGHKVKYPFRPRKIINGYLWKEPKGCLVVEDEGKVIASAHCHVWGRVGWFGPFEVHPEKQGKGVGRVLLSGCEDYLARAGCIHFGLETMPYIMKNVHFYLHTGYRPQQFTCIMEKRLSGKPEVINGIDRVDSCDLGTVLPEISALSRLYHPDLDLSREVEMAVREGLGALFVSRSDENLTGFGVLHAFHPIEESDHSAIRLLLVDPHRADASDQFDRLMRSLENQSLLLDRRRMFVRFTVTPLLYEEMRRREYILEGSNMRMVKGPGYSEKEGFIMASWAG